MQLVLSILSAGVIVSSLALNKPEFGQKVGETFNGDEISQLIGDKSQNSIALNKPEKNVGRRILIEEDSNDSDEDLDFVDDEEAKVLLGVGSVSSLMHVHQEEGEVLIPCFGMWWPMGGYGGGGYEYVDYYGDGDNRRKRRRSKKQKKAKMKRKKS